MGKYKLKVILRSKIYRDNIHLHDDEGLKALGGYYESAYEEVEAPNRHKATEFVYEKYKGKLKAYFDNAQYIFSDDSPDN